MKFLISRIGRKATIYLLTAICSCLILTFCSISFYFFSQIPNDLVMDLIGIACISFMIFSFIFAIFALSYIFLDALIPTRKEKNKNE